MPVAKPVPNAEKELPPFIDLLSPLLPPTAKAVSPVGEKITSSILPLKICVQLVPEFVLLYNPLFPSAARSCDEFPGLILIREKYVDEGKPDVNLCPSTSTIS